MISFDNTETAFKGKSDKDLKRAHFLFKMVAKPGMVKFGKWATNIALKLHLPISGIIKKTIFKQFCGGISVQDSLGASQLLADRNVKTILDYSIEGKTAEEDFDKTVLEIVKTIIEAKKNKNIPFAVFKVTGICLFETLQITNESSEGLSKENQIKYDKLIERIDTISKAAYDNDVPLFVDAEETWIQNTIDRIVHQMSLKYNKESAIIYNTIQLYRHDRLSFFKDEIELARKENRFIGMKLVRGAYMEKERERAEKKGYPSPIQPNKDATDKDFDDAIRLAFKHKDIVSICAGSHNEESANVLVQLLRENNIDTKDPRFYFAQLFGMSDHISFNLAEEGFMVAKYLPYGPIKEVLPYLIRRAEENTSVAGQTTRELALIEEEIKRRKNL